MFAPPAPDAAANVCVVFSYSPPLSPFLHCIRNLLRKWPTSLFCGDNRFTSRDRHLHTFLLNSPFEKFTL